MLLLHKHLLFSQAPTFKDRLSAPFGANGWIVYQSARTRARGKMNFFQKSVLASQKYAYQMQNCNIFSTQREFKIRGQESGVRGQGSGVRSWSSELELESGVGERSWRWSGSPSERIRRIRRGSARRSFRPPPTSTVGRRPRFRTPPTSNRLL